MVDGGPGPDDAQEGLKNLFSRVWAIITWHIVGVVFVLSTLGSSIWLLYIGSVQGLAAGAFAHATITISLAFHIFSVGNTAFSCGVSLGDEDLIKTGEEITNNGKVMVAGGALILFSSFMWLMNTYLPELYPRISFGVGILAFAIGTVGFLYAVYMQGEHSDWYDKLYEEVSANAPQKYVVDGVMSCDSDNCRCHGDQS